MNIPPSLQEKKSYRKYLMPLLCVALFFCLQQDQDQHSIQEERQKNKTPTELLHYQENTQNLQQKSGVSFYFPMYQNTIGSGEGISCYQGLVQSIFATLQKHNIQAARTRLTIGSERNAGIVYDPSHPEFLGFATQAQEGEQSAYQQAKQDIITLLVLAQQHQVQQSLVLHNFDIASPESYTSIITNPEHQEQFISQTEQLLKCSLQDAIEGHGIDILGSITGIEFINEPDNMWGMYRLDQQQCAAFVQAGIAMIKRVETDLQLLHPECDIRLPAIISVCKAKNTEAILQTGQLEAGDYFDLHYYHEPLFNNLETYHTTLERLLPSGVTLRFGELPGHDDQGNNIMQQGVDLAYDYGTQHNGTGGIFFWYDDRIRLLEKEQELKSFPKREAAAQQPHLIGKRYPCDLHNFEEIMRPRIVKTISIQN